MRVVRHAGGDMLENGCAGCRLVSVQRTRPGAGKPTSQTLTVPEHITPAATVPRSRAYPDHRRASLPRHRAATAPAAATAPEQKCVRFVKNRTGGAALINPCQVCRAVKVEFVDTAGNRTHRAFAIGPRSPLSFPAAGLAKARILTDAPCG